jgi:hypothetical protein
MLISHKKVGEEVVQRVTEDGTKGRDGGGLTGVEAVAIKMERRRDGMRGVLLYVNRVH